MIAAHTELYGLLECSCSFSTNCLFKEDEKCTEVKSGNDPVLLPIPVAAEEFS